MNELAAFNGKEYINEQPNGTVEGNYTSILDGYTNSLYVMFQNATIASTVTFGEFVQLYKNGNYYEASYSNNMSDGSDSVIYTGYIKIELGNNSITVVDGQLGISAGSSRGAAKWTNETLTNRINY